ncbi:MAG: DUF5808 domain-containing protein [Terriglobales bacterium]
MAGTDRTLPFSLPPHRNAYLWISAGPFLILAAHAALLHAGWQRIPARFPIHWNASGAVNGWATRNFWGVYGLLLMAAAFCVLCLFLGHATLHWAQHPHGATSPDHRRGTAWSLLACSYLLALVFSFVSMLPLRGAASSVPRAWIVLPAVLIPLAVAVLLAFAWRSTIPAPQPPGQHPPPPHESTGHGYRLLGAVYYNPDDPRVIVPKRIGIGVTVNLAQPRGWLLLVAIGTAITIALVLSSLSH